MKMHRMWILLVFLLSNSLLFSQHIHIGDFITTPDGSEGVVFYLTPEGTGGWMVALTDQSSECRWGTSEDIPDLPNYAAQTTDPLLLEIDGKENTRKIRAFQNNNTTYAAGQVDFEHGWYLPSAGQMRILASKLALIESSLIANGGTSLSRNKKYWTSTEHSATNVKVLDDAMVGFHAMLSKTSNAAVRAIHDFSFLEWSTGVVADSIEVFPTENTAYSVTLTEGMTCPGYDYTASVNVVVHPVPKDVTIVPANPLVICEGEEITLQAHTSNNGNWTYQWSEILTGQTFSGTGSTFNLVASDLGVGSYQIQVLVSSPTNGDCNDTAILEVTVLPSVTASIEGEEAVCPGDPVTLTAYPGGMSYLWNTGATTQSITVTPTAQTTNYSVTVTNPEGCDDDATYTVTLFPSVEASIGGDATVCPGQTVTLTALPNYMTYQWSNGATTQSITVSAGDYSVTVTSPDGCSGEASHSVTENPPVEASIDGDFTVCPGQTLTLTALPNNMTYLWSNGATTQSITVSAGDYSVTVTSSDGCSGEASHTVTEYPSVEASIDGDASVCPGQTVTLTAYPGGMSYQWSTGATSQSITVSAGEYSVTVTSPNGCSDIVTHTVTDYPSVDATIDGDATVCPGQTVTLTAYPGGMSYQWNTGATSQSITVAAGEYSVTVTSPDGCSGVASHSVTENSSVEASIDGETTVCPGQTVTLTAYPGGMSYQWNTGATSQSITVAAGEYSVTVTSPDGCSGVASHSVTENSSVEAMIVGETEVCSGNTVTLTAYPGGMSYQWNTGATSQSITVAAGEYSVTVTSPDGCSGNATHSVTDYPSVEAIIDGETTVCPDHTVTLTAYPGGMSYQWNTGATTQSITVPAGEYSVTVTSSDGCFDNASHSVTLNPLPTADAGLDQDVAYGASAILMAADAGAGATYSWTPAAMIQGNANQRTVTTVGLTEDQTYTLTVISSEGCQNTDEVTVHVGEQLVATVAAEPTAVCPNENATLMATATGGTGNYTYNWTPAELINSGQGTAVATTKALTQTTVFTCNVGDGNETLDLSVTVTVYPVPMANAGPNLNVPFEGNATLTAEDAGEGATYSWEPADMIQGDANQQAVTTVELTEDQTYTLTVTSAEGCVSAPDEVTIFVGDALVVSASASPNTICFGENSTLMAEVTGGTAPYSYAWGPSEYIDGDNTTPTVTTTLLEETQEFTLTVTDGDGTMRTDQVLVTVNSLPTVQAIADDPQLCEGSNTMLHTPEIAGATYSWSPADMIEGEANQNVVTTTVLTETTTFAVTVISSSGCESTDEVTVTVNSYPTANAGPDLNVPFEGTATLTAEDAGEGATYSWEPASMIDGDANQQTVTTVGLTEEQTYTLTVTSSAGCQSTDEVTVFVGDQLIATVTTDPETICFGETSTLTVTVSGGTEPYTYLWEPSEYIDGDNTTATVTTIPLEGTQTFTLTVTDADETSRTEQVTVTVKPQPTANAGPDQSVAFGGAATLMAADAGEGATYSWEPASMIDGDANQQTVSTVGLTEEQTFTLTVTSADGCVSVPDEVTVYVGDVLLASASAEPETICFGETSTLTATATGGTEPYTYLWEPSEYIDGGNTMATVMTLPLEQTITFELTVTDADETTRTEQVTVTVKPQPTVEAIADDTQLCDGSSTMLHTPAVAGATYSWSPADMIEGEANQNEVTTIALTEMTTFSVTVTLDGCEATSQVTVEVNPVPEAEATADDPQLCEGSNTMLHTPEVAGATYSWLPAEKIEGEANQHNVTTTALTETTTFTVTVTLDNCESTSEVTVMVNPNPTADAGPDQSVTPETPATLIAADAGEGATYSWEPADMIDGDANQQTVTTIELMEEQTFTLTVTSAEGCVSAPDEVTVYVGDVLLASASADPTAICFGETSTLTATVTGGTEPYTYLWEPSEYIDADNTTAMVTTIPLEGTQTFTLTVTDDDGTTRTDQVTVTVRQLPIADAGQDQSVTPGTPATLTAAYAGEGATYSWEPADMIDGDANQQTVTTIELMEEQTFTLTVTSADGCVSVPDEVTVYVGDALLASASADPTAICFGETSTLTAMVTGGTEPYTYLWEPSEYIDGDNTTATVTTIPLEGIQTFTLTVTDADGTTRTDQVTVTVNPLPIADAGQDQSVAPGTPATLTAASAGEGATYAWEPADMIDGDANQQTVNTIALTEEQTFTLTVTSAEGCVSVPDEVTVYVGDALLASASADPTAICFGETSTLTATVTGGTEPYTYLWEPSEYINGDNTTATVTTIPLEETMTFELTVTDADGTTRTDQVTVTVNPLPIADAGPDQSVAFGTPATLTATYAGVGATYAWEPAEMIDGDPNQQTVTTIALTEEQTFTLTVTSAEGCVSVPDEVTVYVGDALLASASADPTAICFGETSTLTATVTGGTEPYTYLWEPSEYIDGDDTTPMVTTTPLEETMTFELMVTDGDGTTQTAEVTVTVNPLPIADAGQDQTVVYEGIATLTAVYAGADATYFWEPAEMIDGDPNQQTVTTMPLTEDQTFTLTVTSSEDCTSIPDIVMVTVLDQLIAQTLADPPAVCSGGTVMLTATATGGMGAYSYDWQPADLINGDHTTPSVTTTILNTDVLFTCIVTDQSGSMTSDSVMVTVESPYVGTVPVLACDFYTWSANGVTYEESGQHTESLTSALGCDSIVTLDLTIIHPELEILGYKDIFFASDIWHGIYNYYVVDSVTIPLAPIEWHCSNPDWILIPVSDYHCELIATTADSCVLTAHTLIAENCDEEMSIEIKSREYYEDVETPISLFPNPARSKVTVQADGLIHVRMFSILGQLVKEVGTKAVHSVDIDIENLKRGVYMVEITTINEVVIKRLILSK